MTILDRYIVRSILGSVLLVMTVVLILGALFVFIDQQDDIGVGHYTAVEALWYTLLNLPQQAFELLPITVLIGSLLGLGSLARLRPRQGRYARVWIAVVIYFLYQNLITVGKVWISRGTVPEVAGLWWTHAAVVLLALTVIMGPTIATRFRYRVRGL